MFIKYPSLTNDYAIGKVRAITSRLDEQWYATEKIHGANASVSVFRAENGNYGSYIAKRSGPIALDDKQFAELPDTIPARIFATSLGSLAASEKAKQIIVFGEFFGKGVQVMDYDIIKNGEKAFRVFNVFIILADNTCIVMGRNEMVAVLGEENMVPITKQGTLRELLESELTDESMLGGYKEGEVYKPLSTFEYDLETPFPVVKRKTQKFLEVSDKPKVHKVKPNLSLEALVIQEELGQYITWNRLNNVLSHGEFELIPQNIGKIMMALKEDTIAEYVKETSRIISDDIELNSLIRAFDRDIAMMIKDKIQEESRLLIAAEGK